MLQAVKTTLLLLSALFPIVNPLGGSPIFLALTGDYTPPERRLLSQRIAINSFALLVASCLIGTHILAFFGISLPIVQVGGGLIVVATGWDMLSRTETTMIAAAACTTRSIQKTFTATPSIRSLCRLRWVPVQYPWRSR